MINLELKINKEEFKKKLDLKDGKDYVLTQKDKKEIAESIKVPIVEKVIERTEVIKEKPIVTNEIKEVAITDKPEEIVEKINKSKKKISWKQIKDVPDFETRDTMNQVGYLTGVGDISLKLFINDLSPMLDGSTKTFTITQNRIVWDIKSSSFPYVFRENIDYTISGVSRETLTFTDQIDADATLASGQTLIVTGIRP